ncbi:MAG: response regulator [Rhizobiaceae bacterium]|nr:response regulator [Rhizobiaceae bacterium]
MEKKKTIRKLMMIDDNILDHTLYRFLIERTGLVEELVSMLDAREALTYLAKNHEKIDLILLDINMPGMSGFDFLEEVREMLGDEFTKPIIIMLTTSMDPKDIDRASRYQMVKDYCNKPLSEQNIEEFARLVAGSQGS